MPAERSSRRALVGGNPVPYNTRHAIRNWTANVALAEDIIELTHEVT